MLQDIRPGFIRDSDIEEGGELAGDVSTTRASASETRNESAPAAGDSPDVMTAYDPFARKSKSVAKSGPGSL